MKFMNGILGTAVAAFVALGMSFSAEVNAQGAVVSQTQVDAELVRRIFLGQTRDLVAVNLPEGDETRARFETEVIGRSSSQMQAHWSRLVFTGRAVALREVASDEDVLSFVRSNANTIGYISDASKAEGLHIIATF
ncbi:MAG: phosphate ABC transporter substrate-binding protein [Idiomarina sp.]|nr:phosphate ABC transporter substrate-binding protein [Idiomarina sp.]